MRLCFIKARLSMTNPVDLDLYLDGDGDDRTATEGTWLAFGPGIAWITETRGYWKLEDPENSLNPFNRISNYGGYGAISLFSQSGREVMYLLAGPDRWSHLDADRRKGIADPGWYNWWYTGTAQNNDSDADDVKLKWLATKLA